MSENNQNKTYVKYYYWIECVISAVLLILGVVYVKKMNIDDLYKIALIIALVINLLWNIVKIIRKKMKEKSEKGEI